MGVKKTLVTENLPTKSHEAPKLECRHLVRNQIPDVEGQNLQAPELFTFSGQKNFEVEYNFKIKPC